MTALAAPQRTTRYASKIVDSQIWERFEMRADDVVVVTPPKCGTTWTQSLVVSLIDGRPGGDIGISERSYWLDPGFRNVEDIAARTAAQTGRRCIKTHTPLDGVTFHPDCRYIGVFRHPIDAHFSMRRHHANMSVDLMGERFPDDPRQSFAIFLDTPPEHEMGDGVSLDSIAHHFRCIHQWAHLPNILILHYADLTRDLAGEAARVSAFLGYDHGPDLLAEIAASLAFETVQTNARSAKPRPDSVFKDPSAFFDSATSRKWDGHLTDEDVAAYRTRLGALLPPDQAAWLEDGGPLP